MIVYSTHGKRIGAYLIDGMLTALPYIVVVAVVTVMQKDAMDFLIVSPIVQFIYGFLMEMSSAHATLGKRCVKIKVADKSGSAPKTLDVAVRNALKILPTVLCCFSTDSVLIPIASILILVYYLVPLCNQKHLALHDMIASTAVIQRESNFAIVSQGNMPQNMPQNMSQNMPSNIPQYVSGMYRLICIKGVYEGASFDLNQPIIMGREVGKCNLIFPEETKGISRVHCRVSVENNRVLIQDMGSTYGFSVNGIHKDSGERISLIKGNLFTIGKNEVFRID